MDLFEYISVLTSIIIGLGIAHLLRGLAGLVQHPGRHEIYWVHLVWVGYCFFGLLFFWWWEFALSRVDVWLFQNYLFLVFYAVLNYLLCAMLFPGDLDDYDGFKDYFLSRRRWFFGVLALSLVADVYDTWMKGADYFAGLGAGYFVLTGTQLAICGIGIYSRHQVVHTAIALLALIYQIDWAFTFWGQLGGA